MTAAAAASTRPTGASDELADVAGDLLTSAQSTAATAYASATTTQRSAGDLRVRTDEIHTLLSLCRV